jgi:Autophagy-related protein 27
MIDLFVVDETFKRVHRWKVGRPATRIAEILNSVTIACNVTLLFTMSRRLLLALVLFGSLCATTLAAEWDCRVTLSLHDYDLTSLGQETVEHTRENPPSQMVDRVTFDLCKPIQEESSDLPTSDKACQVNAIHQSLDSQYEYY